MEGKKWNGENGDEAVDSRALIGSENFPPPDRTVSQEHGDVERNNSGQHSVEILP